MTEATQNRPSDTEAAHAPDPGAAEGDARVDQNFVSHIEGAERRERTGQPIHGRSDTTVGEAVADRISDEAVPEGGDGLASGQVPRR